MMKVMIVLLLLLPVMMCSVVVGKIRPGTVHTGLSH
jgi:hypothetical protein